MKTTENKTQKGKKAEKSEESQGLMRQHQVVQHMSHQCPRRKDENYKLRDS